MITPISPANLPLEFSTKSGELSRQTRIFENRIGWLRAVSPDPGMKFDVVIKDARGMERFRRHYESETTEAGELINIPTSRGEDIEVSLENIEQGEEIKVFLD